MPGFSDMASFDSVIFGIRRSSFNVKCDIFSPMARFSLALEAKEKQRKAIKTPFLKSHDPIVRSSPTFNKMTKIGY